MSSEDESEEEEAGGQASSTAQDNASGAKKLRLAADDAVMTLRCDICNVSVTSKELMREHLQGRKHAATAKIHAAKLEGRYCECCAIVFTGGSQMAEHVKGRKHREQAAKAAGDQSIAAGPKPDGGKQSGKRKDRESQRR